MNNERILKELIIESIKNEYKINEDKLNKMIEESKNIKWKKLFFQIPLAPVPSPRPRVGKFGIYVPKNKQVKSDIEKYIIVKNQNYAKKCMKKFINKNNLIYTANSLI